MTNSNSNKVNENLNRVEQGFDTNFGNIYHNSHIGIAGAPTLPEAIQESASYLTHPPARTNIVDKLQLDHLLEASQCRLSMQRSSRLVQKRYDELLKTAQEAHKAGASPSAISVYINSKIWSEDIPRFASFIEELDQYSQDDTIDWMNFHIISKSIAASVTIDIRQIIEDFTNSTEDQFTEPQYFFPLHLNRFTRVLEEVNSRSVFADMLTAIIQKFPATTFKLINEVLPFEYRQPLFEIFLTGQNRTDFPTHDDYCSIFKEVKKTIISNAEDIILEDVTVSQYRYGLEMGDQT